MNIASGVNCHFVELNLLIYVGVIGVQSNVNHHKFVFRLLSIQPI